MILTDFLLSEKDITWDFAKQTGVNHCVVRLPEKNFDYTDLGAWSSLVSKYESAGFKPLVIEPVPNCIHDNIKKGNENRDKSIETLIKMFPIMNMYGINTLCANFMAHIGWLRTSSDIKERGGALVTGFDIQDYKIKEDYVISEETLWQNLRYFIKAIVPFAEANGIKIALHPDDPPISKIGNVSRILTSVENIDKALNIVDSHNLGITMCQATFSIMGEDLFQTIPHFAQNNKIFYVHFRNAVGDKYNFRETFHDNGQIDMAAVIRLYRDCGVSVPIRVDHVPTMAKEDNTIFGYTALGRLYAIGYLKGLLEAIYQIKN